MKIRIVLFMETYSTAQVAEEINALLSTPMHQCHTREKFHRIIYISIYIYIFTVNVSILMFLKHITS